jgi:hypothetical protein
MATDSSRERIKDFFGEEPVECQDRQQLEAEIVRLLKDRSATARLQMINYAAAACAGKARSGRWGGLQRPGSRSPASENRHYVCGESANRR